MPGRTGNYALRDERVLRPLPAWKTRYTSRPMRLRELTPFFTGLKTPGEIDVVSDALSIPIILGSTSGINDFDYLAAKGVRIALQGHTPFLAAVKTVYDTLKDIRDGAHPEDLSTG